MAKKKKDFSMDEQKKIKNALHFLVGSIILIGILSYFINYGLDLANIYGIVQSPVTFSLVHFVGYIFFVVLPGEELMFFYFLFTKINPLLIIFLAVATAAAAQAIDYLIGRLVSTKIINRLVNPKRYRIAQRYVTKYGGMIIFFFNLTPFSSPMMLLSAGMLKYDFRKAMLWSTVGLIVKYSLIYLVYAIFF